MRRIGAILTTLALVLVLATGACFADSLTLESSYPADGATGASIENMSVKLYFNGSMSEGKAGKLNDDKVFQLYDSEGKKIPTRTLYGSSEEGVVLVLLDTNKKVKAKSNSEYTLKISGDVVDDNGNKLGKDQQITFKTLNETVNTWVSMGMMVVMFGGMMFASMKGVAKAAEEVKQKEEKVNPYKEAKKTGKSVEEIVEADKKKKAKEAAKAAKKAAREAEWADEEENDNYKVHTKRSAGAAGSKFVAAKREATAKAKAEAAKKKAAAKAAKKKKK